MRMLDSDQDKMLTAETWYVNRDYHVDSMKLQKGHIGRLSELMLIFIMAASDIYLEFSNHMMPCLIV